MVDVKEAIRIIKQHAPNPSKGLGEEIFYFLSELTPMVNVDLLVKDEKGRTLLAFRNDLHTGKGWHLPGGVIRLHEKMETRVMKVAETEIGCKMQYDPQPIAVNEIIVPEKTIRSHFISILYRCSLPSTFKPSNHGLKADESGYLRWFQSCPVDLLIYHDVYRPYL